jgi:uncharacterized protein (TIGR03067 family)
MNRPLWAALATSLLVAVDAPKTDQDRIQGAWVLVARETNGQDDDPASFKKQATMIFEEDRVIVRMGAMSADLGSFTLDPTKTPKFYNRTYTDGTPRYGIYELEGDTLKICIADLGRGRPTTFATKPGDGTSLLVYKREGP